MFAANGHFRRMFQGGDEKKTLTLRMSCDIEEIYFLNYLDHQSWQVADSDRFPFPPSIVQIGSAGSMAGGVMAFVNCPVELLKVKLQTQYTPAVGAAPIAGAIKPVS
jgi:solute carrier family 25 carnitine/acylcarnitine transporter 20/29